MNFKVLEYPLKLILNYSKLAVSSMESTNLSVKQYLFNYYSENKENPDAVQNKYVPPLFPGQSDKLIPFPFGHLDIVLDVSGSTFNVNCEENQSDFCKEGKCRGHRFCSGAYQTCTNPNPAVIAARIQRDAALEVKENILVVTEDVPKPPQTKIIILSILEGTGNTIRKMMKKYNFSGVMVHIYAFSSQTVTCFCGKIKSNTDLYDNIVAKLDVLVPYEMGSTVLYPSLADIFSRSETAKTIPLIILATDGQAHDAGTVRQLLKSKTDQFALICIGAGSIGSGLATRHTHTSQRGQFESFTNGTKDLSSNQTRFTATNIASYGAECDMNYLTSLREPAKLGCYVAACRDYGELKLAIKEFLDLAEAFYVCLDNGTYGKLPSMAQEILFQGKCCYAITEYGKYIMTPCTQIRVEPVQEIPMTFAECTFPEQSYNFAEFRELRNTDKKITITTNHGAFDLKIQTTPGGWPQIRMIHKK